MSPGPDLTDAQADQVTESARELIRFENELLHQRVTWLIQIQGLLFAALGFAWKAAPAPLVILLGGLGTVVAISIDRAMRLYSPAVRDLYEWWKERLTEEQRWHRRVIGLWQPSRVTRIEHTLRPWRFLPVVFILTWLGVILIKLTIAS